MTKHATKRIAVGFVAALALGATACDNDSLTEINDNPNNPTTAPSGPVFTSAVRNAVARWLGTDYSLRGTSLVAQHVAEVQYPESDQYRRLQANSTSDFFDDAYSIELKDLTEVVKVGLAEQEPGIYGPAMAMRVWSFGYLTDTWGDIPYSAALAGDSSESVLSPAYDSQQSIYADFFRTLEKVTTDLAAAPTGGRTLGSADPIYGGNSTRWRQFANTLRARHAMRLANVDPTTARTQIAAAVAAPGGLISSNAENARIVWPGGVNANSNPWSVNFQSRDDHRISDKLMTVLRDNADPRVAVFAQRAERDTTSNKVVKYCTAAAPCFAGLANALTHAEAAPHVPYTSRPGLIFYPASTTYGVSGGQGATTPSYLLTFAEASFLKAEAAERGWITGSARTFYEDGIRASMNQWGITDAAAISAYLAQPSVAYAAGAEGLRKIAVQKWVALFTDGGQAWAEWRRTCQPATIKPGPAAVSSTVPRRFQYSTTEVLTNQSGLDPAIARQGADVFETRMYWDKSPQAAPTFVAGCGTR
ncbi:MAG: SusD/RagB family nutrient-binding outer membrane lipoprotein [Gemmatirosa sp.]